VILRDAHLARTAMVCGALALRSRLESKAAPLGPTITVEMDEERQWPSRADSWPK